MAIVGNAKNAKIVISGWYDDEEEYGAGVTIRGNKYSVEIPYADPNINIKRLPSSLIANTSIGQYGYLHVEAVDNRIRAWSSISADTTYDSATGGKVEVLDSTEGFVVAGAWDITTGTLVSFTSLDSSSVPVTGITLNKSSHTINRGSTYQLAPTIAPSNATNQSVAWASSNTAIATVSSSGLVTAVAAGAATITATTADGGFTATCEMTVQVAVTSISIPETRLVITPNASQLTATILPNDATNKAVAWASSNPSVATISSDGTITPVAWGTATITATSSNGLTDTCAVEVDGFDTVSVTRATLPKYSISAADTVLAGGYIFGDSTNVTNLFDTQMFSSGYPNLWHQTENGIACVAEGTIDGMLLIHPWLAFNKYHDYAVEVEFYHNSDAVGNPSIYNQTMDTALVWYPNEYRYAHLPKPTGKSSAPIGYRYYSGAGGVSWMTPDIQWSNTRDKWIRLRHDYRYSDGKGYVKGSVTIDGVTTTSQEVLIDDVVNFQNPTVSPTVWNLPDGGTIAYRNLKVVSGALSAYSLIFGYEAISTVKANGNGWDVVSTGGGTATFGRDDLRLLITTDGQSGIYGTGTLTMPTIKIPVSSDFELFEVRTTIGTGEAISYRIKDDSGTIKQSGDLANGYNSIPVPLEDKSLTFELVFAGGEITLLDISWTTPEQHTLTYNANGGTGTIPSETGFEFTLASAGFTREGYVLAGWNTAADGSDPSYALGATASFLADTTLYAVWVEAHKIYIGSQAVSKMYLGDKAVIKMYLGDVSIF